MAAEIHSTRAWARRDRLKMTAAIKNASGVPKPIVTHGATAKTTPATTQPGRRPGRLPPAGASGTLTGHLLPAIAVPHQARRPAYTNNTVQTLRHAAWLTVAAKKGSQRRDLPPEDRKFSPHPHSQAAHG